MLQRLAVPVCALTLLLAVPSAAQAADVVLPSSRSESMVVPAGRTATLGLRCGSTAAVALNAAVTRQDAGVELIRSAPGRTAGDWRITFAARPGARRRTVSGVIRCLQLDLPRGVSSAELVVNTRVQSGIRLAPGEAREVELECGRAWVGVGHGVARGRRGDVRVASAVPSGDGWAFVLENTGSVRAHAGVSARCLRRVVRTRRSGERVQLAFGVSHRDFSDIATSEDATFSHRCPPRRFAVATGSTVSTLDAIALIRSSPVRDRAARWVFGRADGDAVTNHIVCLDRRSRFR